MKEHPILYSTPMIQAYMQDRKTCTRRVVTSKNSVIGEGGDWSKLEFYGKHTMTNSKKLLGKTYTAETFVDKGFPNPKTSKEDYQYLHVPYDFEDDGVIYRVYCRYEPNDKLWVKETFAAIKEHDYLSPSELSENSAIFYKYGDNRNGDDPDELKMEQGKWRPSIFIPRWASRLTQTITSIRVERLQDITEEDAKNEGVTRPPNYSLTPHYREWFKYLWNKINEKRGYGWDKNLWVWVINYPKYSQEPTKKEAKE